MQPSVGRERENCPFPCITFLFSASKTPSIPSSRVLSSFFRHWLHVRVCIYRLPMCPNERWPIVTIFPLHTQGAARERRKLLLSQTHITHTQVPNSEEEFERAKKRPSVREKRNFFRKEVFSRSSSQARTIRKRKANRLCLPFFTPNQPTTFSFADVRSFAPSPTHLYILCICTLPLYV